MQSGSRTDTPSVTLMLGKAGSTDLVLRPPRPANDNAPRPRTRTVTLRRKLDRSGLEVKVKVPVDEYVGVAVATTISPEGVLMSTVELLHPNPEFNYLVFAEEGNANVVAEWQQWGRKLHVPLFIRSGDGRLMPYSQHVRGVSGSGRLRLVADADS